MAEAMRVTPGDDEALLLEIATQLAGEVRGAPAARPPTLDSTFDRDLGFDSLTRVELVLRVEHAFNRQLPEHVLSNAQTLRDLLRAVRTGTARAAGAPAPTPLAHAPVPAETPDTAATLVEMLEWHAAHHADRTHLVILADDGGEERMTYAELLAEGRRVAQGLLESGVGPGQAVGIMLPTSRDFFRAFTGVLLAGAIPVPIYPPLRWSQLADHLRRQSRILSNCGATLLLTVTPGRRFARALQGLVPTLARVATVDELAVQGDAVLPRVHANDIALLQYTSGSTGDPKGVMLTHANLLANIRAMGRAASVGPEDVFVSWLPLYHDMGLIGAWMGSLCFAFPLVVMPPTAFLARPVRWLHALHRYRGTISAAPNFAYELCATRVDERDLEGLDLSAWRLAFNGAEAVNAETLERFAARFASRGLRREALMPVYGLAECAVGLAFPAPGRGPRIDRIDRHALFDSGRAVPAGPNAAAHDFVACGVPLPGHEIRIVDPAGRELPERVEGRIEFRGPSATSGYFRNAPKTQEMRDDGWLDSGDLGYLAGGELYVTGRAKDIIIRSGQHVHPDEVEQAVGKLPGVRKGCVAVFGVPDRATGTEKVVVLAETQLPAGAPRAALRESIAGAVLSVLGSPADDIVVAPTRTVPKTPSGKIRRAAARDAYLADKTGGGESTWRGLAAFTIASTLGRMRRALRSIGQAAFAAYAWSAVAVLGTIALAAAALPGERGHRALRAVARTLLRVSGLAVTVEGLDQIPGDGALVIVANHSSYIDGPLLFALLPPRVSIVAKRELTDNPVLRHVLRAANLCFVERFDVERSAEDAQRLGSRVRNGEALLFFAEGTFTRAPGLRPFHMGAFLAAAQSGAPLVTVAVRGTRSVLRPDQWRPARGPIDVRVSAPIRARYHDWNGAGELRRKARAQILATCGEPDLED